MPILAERYEGPEDSGTHFRRWWCDEGTSRRETEQKYLPLIEEYANLVDVEASAGVDLFIGVSGSTLSRASSQNTPSRTPAWRCA